MAAPMSTALRSSAAALRSHWRPVLHWAVVVVAIAFLLVQAPKLAADVRLAADPLGHLRREWLLPAVVAGLGGLALYGEMHRQLLLVGQARIPVPTVQGITFAQNAISNTVPVVGGAGALVYAIDQLRRYRVDASLASWAVFVAGVLDTVALLVLGILGLGWAAYVPAAVAIPAAVVVALGSAGCWIVLTHARVLERAMHLLLVISRRLPGQCPTCRRAWVHRAEEGAHRLAGRIALLRPSARRWLVLFVLVVASWALDFLTLVAAAAAVGTPVRAELLVLGFLVVQGSVALQIFPGGAGLASVGLLGVLLASGTPAAAAAATTVLYRGISWLGLAVAGWVVYVARIHTGPLHEHRHAPEHAAT
ncbi:lysylphosphatidylglycerol synthase transmembrane domain-containing protein [Saccharopolyspora rosea]|uniref:YbhN family protein n=1 Tax=Saccharopolyspora rosea TaxID=524884 RepID=A0ABW3FUK1_9PSEU|nr:lysylphosphatidylglycerol synthase transmembrane domain-containing protein [Saccharopolyspora rosea]